MVCKRQCTDVVQADLLAQFTGTHEWIGARGSAGIGSISHVFRLIVFLVSNHAGMTKILIES